jgi:hypothetical protein
MSNSISFKCNESTTQLFLEILHKLAKAGDNNHTRKIRVGGDEYAFVGGCDTVSDIAVDGSLYANFTDAEKEDFVTLRDAVAITSMPAPVATLPSPSTGPSCILPTTSFSNPTVDTDDDLLDSADAIAVKDVITSKVTQNQMFTAFDITKDLRTNGTQVHHRNIKRIVHALYNQGEMQGYDRCLVTIGSARPFLYHPISADPATYQA